MLMISIISKTVAFKKLEIVLWYNSIISLLYVVLFIKMDSIVVVGYEFSLPLDELKKVVGHGGGHKISCLLLQHVCLCCH